MIDSSDENYTDFGIRSLKISADGKLMATGDRNGNLRVHNTDQWKQLTYQEAHDSEILSIDMTCRPGMKCKFLLATFSVI
jgi:WD40 repeat protein